MLTPSQQAEITRLQAHFPFAIVGGWIDKDSGEFGLIKAATRHKINRLAREGHEVYLSERRK